MEKSQTNVPAPWMDKPAPPSTNLAPPSTNAIGRPPCAVQILALFDGAIVALEHRRPGERFVEYTIGATAGASFSVSLDAPSPFSLVTWGPEGFEVGVPVGARGEIIEGEKTIPLDEWPRPGRTRRDPDGARRIELDNNIEICIDVAEVTFRVRLVEPGLVLPRTVRPDWRAHRYTASVLLFSTLACLASYSVPPDLKSLSLDAFGAERRFATFLIKPPEEPPAPLDKSHETDPGPVAPRGKQAKGPTGKMGSPTAKNTSGRFKVKGPSNNPDPHLARAAAVDLARNAGILSLLHGGHNAAITSAFSTRDSVLGVDAESAMGGLLGTEARAAFGDGGLGIIGHGPGGGGARDGYDTVGLSTFGVMGHNYPNGRGGRSGYPPSARLGPKPNHVPPGFASETKVVGSLDKEIIRRVIRRHLNEVKFCYERELTKRPDLYGRIGVQFTIGAAGQVITSTVQTSTLGSPGVEGCVAEAVRRWEFPRPLGGIVIVSYPFVLQRAGSGGE